LCLTLAISDNSEEPEVELYEDVVGDEYWNSPIRDQTSSMVPVAFALAKGTTLHGPTFINDDSRRTVEATETFAHAPRPDPRDYTELAEAIKEEPRYNDGVAATLAPNVGLEVSRYPESWRQSMPTVGPPRGDDRVSCTIPVTSVPDSDSRMTGLLDERPNRNDRDGLRSEALVAPKSPFSSRDVRPRSPPMSWMTAIPTSVNSFWRTLYGGSSIPTTAMTVADGDVIVRPPQPLGGLPCLGDDRLPNSMQGVRVDQVQSECPELGDTRSSFWRFDSETAIALDEPQVERREPELDLRVTPRSGRSMRDTEDSNPRDRTHRRELMEADGRERRVAPDQRRNTRRSRSAAEEVRESRQTDGRRVDCKRQSLRRSKKRQDSENKYDGRTDDRRRESSRSNRCADRRGSDSRRARDGDSSPSSSDDDEYSFNKDRRRRPNRRPSRPRRRDDPSPDGGDGTDDDGSSEDDDRVEARDDCISNFRSLMVQDHGNPGGRTFRTALLIITGRDEISWPF